MDTYFDLLFNLCSGSGCWQKQQCLLMMTAMSPMKNLEKKEIDGKAGIQSGYNFSALH